MKIINLLPIPFKLEIEDMTPDESELFAQTIRPGLDLALPGAAKKSPFKMLGVAFVVGVLGKLKATPKTPGAGKKIKPEPSDVDANKVEE